MLDIDKIRNLAEDPEEGCECRLTVNERGEPTVLWPDAQSQERVVRAMEEHRDVLVRVSPVLIESDPEDEVDQADNDVDADPGDDEGNQSDDDGFADLGDDDDTDEEVGRLGAGD